MANGGGEATSCYEKKCEIHFQEGEKRGIRISLRQRNPPFLAYPRKGKAAKSHQEERSLRGSTDIWGVCPSSLKGKKREESWFTKERGGPRRTSGRTLSAKRTPLKEITSICARTY